MKPEYSFFTNLGPLSIYFEEDDKDVINLDENIQNIDSKLLKFPNRITSLNQDAVAHRLLAEINHISAQLYQLWHKYIDFIRFFPKNYSFILSHEYSLKYQEEMSKFVKRSIMNVNEGTNLIYPIEANTAELNKGQVDEIRNFLTDYFTRNKIEILSQLIKPSIFPIIFEEAYVKQMLSNEGKPTFLYNDNENQSFVDESSDNLTDKKFSPSLHLFILVHGFQGNSYDMRLIKNNISLINPSCVFLCSTSNQEDTECDIETMGTNLANEVRTFLKDWYNGIIFKKISFIGHSLGGLIIRACLPHLKEFSNKFYMYMSLSTPHLGYTYSSSKIIDAGMWFLKAWKKSKSLEQISLTDGKTLEECFLYKLSNFEGLNYFTYVMLLSSHQDYYAPFESTRVQVCDKAMDNSDEKAKMYKMMALNIVNKVKKECFRRIDVNFVIPEKNIDSFIGRTAHIQFLENQNFMKILFNYYIDLWK